MAEFEAGSPKVPTDLEHDGVARTRVRRDAWIGRRVGRAKILSFITADTRGRVYRAESFGSESPKRLVVRRLGTGVGRKRLLKNFALERERLERLEHPNIVRLFDVGSTRSGQLYWITPEVEGVRIDWYCDEQQLDLEARLRLFLRVGAAVATAHEHGIVHGALHAENIIVNDIGQPLVLDCGLAMLLGRDSDDDPAEVTAARALPGENAGSERTGIGSLGTEVDVHALGILLDTLRRGISKPRAQELGALLDACVRRATHVDPEQRHVSVQDLILDLRGALAARFASGRSRPERSLTRLAPQRRTVVLAALATLAVMSVVYALGRWPDRDAGGDLGETEARAYAEQIAAAEIAIREGRAAAARGLLAGTTADLRGWEWNHLWARLDRSLISVPAHAAPVTAVAFGADDRLVATCAADRTIRLWDAASGELVGSLGPTPAVPRTLAMHPQLEWVAVGCDSGLVLVLDRDNHVRGRFEEAPWPRLASHATSSVRERAAAMEAEPPLAPAVAFDPAGSLLAVGSCSGDVVLWEVPSLRRLTRWRLRHAVGVTLLAFTPDGKRLAMGSPAAGSPIHVWDLKSLDRATEISASHGGQRVLAFTDDGEALAWVSMRGSVQVYDARAARAQAQPYCSDRTVRAIAFGRSAAVLYGVSPADSCQRLVAVEVATGRVQTRLVGHTAALGAVAVSADGALLATADDQGTLKIWDTRVQDVRSFGLPWGMRERQGAADVGVSSDGSWILSTSPNGVGQLGIWNVPSDVHEMVSIGGDTSRCLALGPGAGFTVVGQAGGDVCLFDFAANVVRWRQRGHAGSVRAVDVAPSGHHFVTGGDDGLVLVWDVDTHTVTRKLAGHVGAVLDVEYTPDGTTIVSGGQDGTVRIWKAQSGKLRRILPGHTGAVPAVACTPDGLSLASVSTDGTLRMWEISTGKPRATLLRLRTPLLSVGFTPDGTRLAAAGVDGMIHLLDPRTLHGVASLHGHEGPIVGLEFTPVCGSLVTSSRDGTICFWDAGRGVAGLEPPRRPGLLEAAANVGVRRAPEPTDMRRR